LNTQSAADFGPNGAKNPTMKTKIAEIFPPGTLTTHRYNNRDQKYMKTARRLAINVEPVSRARVAAVLVLKNHIVSVGQCVKRSHPYQARVGRTPESIFLHAEIHALVAATNHLTPSDFARATLYVHRVKRLNSDHTRWIDGLARPCSGCQRAIAEFGVGRVVYSTDQSGVWNEWSKAN
jgi:deoxycytidylate deaminase